MNVKKQQISAMHKACLVSGNQRQLSKLLGVTPVTVSLWCAGRTISPKRCVQIERATNGQVTRKDLRPDDWHLIWPELEGR